MKKRFALSRREFLEFMGKGALAASFAGSGMSLLQACARSAVGQKSQPIFPNHPFLALTPSKEDSLRLASGLRFQKLIAWNDPLNDSGLRFGYNNDFLAYFPLSSDKKEGLLCVNHETPHPLFVAGYTSHSVKKTKSQVEQEMDATGVSIVHIKQENTGDWKVLQNSSYNRFINGRTRIPFAGGKKIVNSSTALGTLGNCAGGITPWGTYLTCEENYNLFYGETKHSADGTSSFDFVKGKGSDLSGPFNWFEHYPQPPEHYGWVVEIHPRTGKAKKLTALGRMAHESATVRLAKNGIPVVYMGDDANDMCFYKFISKKKGSLIRGDLYVANLETGKWIPLSWKDQPLLKKNFKNQDEVLIRAREAAKILGATPLDRPEDVEVCPKTGAVFVTLTNNKDKDNFFGSILKLEEAGNDPLSLSFQSSTFLAGGESTGFACPDNLEFDPKGNLWMTTDISGSSMNKGPYTPFMNNGLFFIPMSGKDAGKAFLVATAPTDAEFTGPRFTPDGRTLFLSVQHPGEDSKSLKNLTSHWPEGGNSIPKPAVVAISGPLLDTIMGA